MILSKLDTSAESLAALSDLALARSCPALLGAMIAEIVEGATPDQAGGFFAAVGARIAALAPVDDIEDVDALVTRINALWHRLEWGRASFKLDDEGIDIGHDGMPPDLTDGQDVLWKRARGPILEGAYDTWFRALGSGPNLRTRVIGESEQGIMLRHGL